MNSQDRARYLLIINDLKERYTDQEIEAQLISDFIELNGLNRELALQNDLIYKALHISKSDINESFINRVDIKSMEVLEYAFECLLSAESKEKHGIVFTPEYIVNNIVNYALEDIDEHSYNDISPKIIDPACGCGAFLRGALIKLKSRYPERTLVNLIQDSIYGIDIKFDNIRRAKIILLLHCMLNGEYPCEINFNLIEANTLKTNLKDVFNCRKGFDFIIGNPPYVNPHDLSNEDSEFIKNHFITTQIGTTNIYYAFIEHCMEYLCESGNLVFIIPNNFLTIKAGTDLRDFIQSRKYLDFIIDFKDNMIFRPVRTYNCIIRLNKKNKIKFKYAIMEKTDDIRAQLSNLQFHDMSLDSLDVCGWKLMDDCVFENIKRIENAGVSIKPLIRTGIATLRDGVYLLDGYDEKEMKYFKAIEGKVFYIEPEITKPIYKISDIKRDRPIEEVERRIIFPYLIDEKNNVQIIDEQEFIRKFPNAYNYLYSMKHILDERDKGKPNPVAWYAYGRTQGLKNYGSKLIFPTFIDHPKFMFLEDRTTLFCNGYAICDNGYIELDVVQKILNSVIMKYYVSKTSYAIDGGYYCYQKKYIEKFSLPLFSEQELNFLRFENNQDKIDDFLIRKYNVSIEKP